MKDPPFPSAASVCEPEFGVQAAPLEWDGTAPTLREQELEAENRRLREQLKQQEDSALFYHQLTHRPGL